jgi:membrane protein required for colicin V production
VTWLDYAVFGVLAISIGWGAWRGLVREIISILGWVIAFLAAGLLAGPLAVHMPDLIPEGAPRVLAAYVSVFLSVLVITTLLGLLLSRLVKLVGLGGLDALLGAMFGTARGALIVLALAILAGLTSAPRQQFWRDSVCAAPLRAAALAIRPWLPATLAERLRYDEA